MLSFMVMQEKVDGWNALGSLCKAAGQGDKDAQMALEVLEGWQRTKIKLVESGVPKETISAAMSPLIEAANPKL